MKPLKKASFSLLFVFLLPLFVCTGITFTFLSEAFCKASITDTAITTMQTDTPVIIIDAGHGGEDGGTVGKNGVYEKDLNLKIAKEINDLALICGYDTVLTRTEDILLYDRNIDFKGRKKALDLLARVNIAKKYENAIFISIHMNAFPDSKYSGLQVYYSKNHADSKIIADEIQNTVRATLQKNNNRKTKQADSSIFVLDNISIPSVLVECGFLSNEEECELLSDENYQKKLALSIFMSVLKYIETPT